jgi:hypothetical protein
VIFAGQRLRSKQIEFLIQLRKVINNCENKKLLSELEILAEKMESRPIVASCGFFSPDLVFLKGVSIEHAQWVFKLKVP